ncbi:hypothetical protein DFQ04_1938 [Algoriphagus boseongensis]|uniref:TonB-dependent receptor-like protein n=2 Tax=Algoriphagus boseongensis TaxID=1442587 RepID=A0A4R6T6V2_9BACT|nr:hypothetical protein DFQ04_1938 [Algoriphagus boseongensis]
MSFIASTFLVRIFNQMDKLKIILLFALLVVGANSVFAQSESKTSPVIITLDGPTRSIEEINPLVILSSDEYQGRFRFDILKQTKINPETIDSMNVIRGEEAIKQFGEFGKNGAIQIYLKENTYKDLPKEIQKLMVKIKE